MKTVRCYNTITGVYVDVEVNEEVGTFLQRSYWREDMQDRRYQKRKLLFNDVMDYADRHDVAETAIVQYEIELLKKHINDLDDRSKRLLYYRYFEEYSLRKVGQCVGLSSSYAARLIKKALDELRQELE